MRTYLRRLASALVGGLALSTAVAVAARAVEIVDPNEVASHRIGPPPVVELPWRDPTSTGPGDAWWWFRVTVDASGTVCDVVRKAGPVAHREAGVLAARKVRFQPFQRDGHDKVASFDLAVQGRPADYAGPADRAFPVDVDPAQFSAALQRTNCFGTCPAYRVEVRGNGEVTYRGLQGALVPGEHHWRVPPARLAPLVDLLRRSDYFRLDGYYDAQITDNPTYVTRVRLGSRRKFVHDYAGRALKDEVPAPGQPLRVMPRAVSDIEDAIDAAAGVASWVQGDEHTMAVLRQARWDFHAPAAGRAVLQLANHCRTALARDFLAAGAPLDLAPPRDFQAALVGAAAGCGDRQFVDAIVARGALAGQDDADQFLAAGAGHGFADFIALALTHGAHAASTDRDGKPVLTRAAEASKDDEGPARGDVAYDPARAIALLVAAGADPNAGDNEGNRPLHSVASALQARALIAAGADANALNLHRQPPLSTLFADDAVPVLLAAGARIDAVDDQGRTPLEATESQKVALALLAAGARLPADPARLSALADHAARMHWTTLSALLESGGRSVP